MPTIGVDCQIILDGSGYFVEPTTYSMKRPKLGTTTTTKVTRGVPIPVPPPTKPVVPGWPTEPPKTSGVPTRILDRGPGQRVWTFNVLCLNTLKRYDGSALGVVGQSMRDALHHSYEKIATKLSFTDPNNYTYQVNFSDITEKIDDLRAQLIGLNYICTCILTEAT